MTIPIRQPGFDYMTLDDFEEMLADKPAHEKWELIGGRVVKMMVGARGSIIFSSRTSRPAFETVCERRDRRTAL